MSTAETPATKKNASLMISYSRKDKPFVKQLYDGLVAQGFDPNDIWVDWEGIALSADWMKEITKGIRSANAFIFVISPDSIASEVCQKEIALADDSNKRFIPILYRELPKSSVLHPKLSSHNWATIKDEKELAEKLPDLVKAINTDLDWLERHTKLFNKAREWLDKGRNDSNLVRGNDLTEAVTFLSEGAAGKKPAPTPLQIEFVQAARKYSATVRRRNRTIAIAVGIALFALTIFSLFQWGNAVTNLELAQTKQAEADANAELANRNAKVAEEQRVAAEASEARARQKERVANANVLAAEAVNQRNSDNQLSLMLALLSIQETAQDNTVLPASRSALFTSLNSPNVLHTWRTDNSIVWTTAYDPQGRYVAIGDDSGLVQVFDAASYDLVYDVPFEEDSITWMDFSPDGERLAVSTGGGRAAVLNASNGDEVFSIDGHDGEAINSIVFSPDGQWIATAGSDYLVKLWYAETGSLKTSLPSHTAEVNAVAFNREGTRLISGGRDDTAILWDVETSSLIYKLRPDGFETDGKFVYSVAFSWDGSRVMTGGYKTVVVWDAETGEELQRLRGNQGTVYDVDFAPDSLSMTTASSGVKVWDWVYGTQRFNLSSHAGEVNSVAFSSDGNRVVTGSWDFTAKLWAAGLEIETLRLKQHGSANTDANYSADGKYLFTISDSGLILIHDAQTGEVLAEASGIFAAFNPQDSRQYLTFDGAAAAVWNIGDSNPLRVINDDGTGFWRVIFHPDGKQVISAGFDGVIKSWDAGSDSAATVLGQTDGNNVLDFYFGDGGGLVVTQEDNDPGLWDLSKSSDEPRLLTGHTDDILTAVFSPDGKYLYSGGYDNTVRKWEVGSGEIRQVMTGHTGRIFDLAVSPDGKLVASASADTTVRVWDAESGKEIYNYQGNNEDSNSVAFSPDGKKVLTASADKTTKEFTIDYEAMLQIARKYELRELSPDECRRYLNRDSCILNLFGTAPAEDGGIVIPATGDGPQARSGAGTTPVTLVIVNDTDLDLDIFWVDFEGLERQYFTLAPGDDVEQGTYNTHIWRARDADGNLVLDYPVTDEPKQTWEIAVDGTGGSETPPLTATEEAASASAGGAFYTEEFDSEPAGWENFMASGGANQVEFGADSGSLFVQLSQDEDKIPYFYLVNPANDYASVQIEAATTNYGNNSNGVSLVCHYDGENWYEFTVSNAGLYSINYHDPTATAIQGVIQLAGGGSAAIKTGPSSNVYRAVCNGNELTLYINDTLVKSLTDTIYNLSGGQIGIGVSSPSTLPVEVSFESLTVSQP